jgi:hypothetical protein
MNNILIVNHRGEEDSASWLVLGKAFLISLGHSLEVLTRRTLRHYLFVSPLKKLAVLIGLPLALFTPRTVAATHNYVQGNYAVPQTPQPTVMVPFTAPWSLDISRRLSRVKS